MDLFNRNPNLLPYDGEVYYHGCIMNQDLAQQYFEVLLESIEWEHDQAIIFGKHIITSRKVAWYGDQPFEYTYSKVTKTALPWTNALVNLKAMVEAKTNEHFNSCLLNLYHNGNEGMAWHSDDEKDLKTNGAIGSLSFGAQRKFSFKHKQDKQKVSVALEPGSLLVMKGTTQSNWLHRLPPTKLVQKPRINLTFRNMIK